MRPASAAFLACLLSAVARPARSPSFQAIAAGQVPRSNLKLAFAFRQRSLTPKLLTVAGIETVSSIEILGLDGSNDFVTAARRIFWYSVGIRKCEPVHT
jgi:hypothetical protein